jgi:hypothetical protein
MALVAVIASLALAGALILFGIQRRTRGIDPD